MPSSCALAGDLGHEGGLALAGLPGDQDDLPPLPGGDTFGHGGQEGQLFVAAHDSDAGTMGQAGRKRHAA